MSDSLCVIPSYMSNPEDLNLTVACLETLREFEPECEALVVDDGSPAPGLVEELRPICERLEFELCAKEENEGFSRTVNVGLRRALENGQHAILVNADIEFIESGWIEKMETQPSRDVDELAQVVGAQLCYPNLFIQHGGVFFSLLHKVFDHRFRYAPPNLPEALRAFVCPVTGALQFIRHSALTEIGLYDEEFRLGWEDVDYCLRVFEAGHECIYQPTVRAIHHESVFRGRPSPKVQEWQALSWVYFTKKWAGVNFARYCPTVI